MSTAEKSFYTAKEAARITGYAYSTMRYLHRKFDLGVLYLNHIIFTPEEIEKIPTLLGPPRERGIN